MRVDFHKCNKAVALIAAAVLYFISARAERHSLCYVVCSH